MKKNYLLFFCFFCITMQAQITVLSKLSKGKFYSSDVIKDKDNNIKGYFLLFESDKVAKEIYDLEYVVLDENLTKVTSGIMTEMQFESWLVKSEKITASVSLFGDKLLLELREDLEDVTLLQGTKPFQRYRILNIKDNNVGKPFIYNNDKMYFDPVFNRKMAMKNILKNTSEQISIFTDIGMVVHSQNYHEKEGVTKKYLAHYDTDLKEVWKYVYADVDEKKQKNLFYLKSDSDVLVMINQTSKRDKYTPEVSLVLVDSKKGTLRKEVPFPATSEFSYNVSDCKISGDKVVVMGNYYKGNKYGTIDDVKNIGYFRFVLDKATGNLISSDYLKWENLKGKLPIDKKGFVKKEGYLYTHNMLLQDNGEIIIIAEAFINKPVTTNNLYFLTIDDKFGFKDVFEVSKFKNKLSHSNAFSGIIKAAGAFDFIDYQNLGDGEYLFFFNDNEKNSSKKKKSTQYGIVSYADGKFKRQTLDLKTENSIISPYNAKKGYLMLVESFEEKNKPSEFRLEKINY